jgi:hypothetical protein
MGLIEEGLTQGAGPEQDFEALLAEQERAAGAERPKRDDPASHDFNRVVQGLVAEVHGSRDISAGEQEVRDALAEKDFTHALRDAQSEDEVLSALHGLRGKAPEAYEAEVFELVKKYVGDPGEMDEEELEEFSSALDTLDNAVQRFGVTADYNRDLARFDELQHKYSVQRSELQREKVIDYFKRAGVTRQQALPRLEAAARLAAEAGIDLNSIEPDDPRFADVLSVFDASNVEARRADATRAFQQRVLGADTADVSSGLEYLTPFGMLPAQSQQLPPAELDPKLINARADKRVRRAVDVRRAVAAPDERDWRRGLTSDGKSISVDDASGGKERAKRQREDDLARSKGLLR